MHLHKHARKTHMHMHRASSHNDNFGLEVAETRLLCMSARVYTHIDTHRASGCACASAKQAASGKFTLGSGEETRFVPKNRPRNVPQSDF